MSVPKEYRGLLYVSYILLHVLCLFNVSFAKKCLHHEGPVVEMCTDSVIQAQHAVILETSLFSGKGNCVCTFNVTGDYLEIGHLDFPEQCGNKLDFHLGAEGSPHSDVQSIECTKVTAEFNTTEVKEGNVLLSQTEFGAAEPGSSCVSMETDPNEFVYVHCEAVVEESTRTLTSDTTADNKLTPISIKDMFQDQSTGASNAIQELLSKSGLSQDSIFMEPNLIQTQSINSLNLMDKMVTPEMIGEDMTASTPRSVSSDSTPMSTKQTTAETTVSSATVPQETSLLETTEPTTVSSSVSSSTTQETTAQTTKGSAISSTVSQKTSSTSSQRSSTTTTTSNLTTPVVDSSSLTSTVASTLYSSTPKPESHTDEHSLSSSTSSPSTTRSSSTSNPSSTPQAVTQATSLKVEKTTVEENVTPSVPPSSTTVSNEVKTTISTQETSSTTAAIDVTSRDKGSDTTTQEPTTKSVTLDVSPTVKSSDITTTILSTTVLGLSSKQEKSTSSAPSSDLTTSVLSSTPKSLPVTTSPVDNIPLKMPEESKTTPSEPAETTTKIFPTKSVKDTISTPSMLEPSTPEILSTSQYTFYTALPDLNELYSEELQRIGSSTVFPVHIAEIKMTTKSDIAKTTSSPDVLNEKATTEAKTTIDTATTERTTTDSPSTTSGTSKTTAFVKPTAMSVTEAQSETTSNAVTKQSSTADNEPSEAPITSTIRTTKEEATTQVVSSTTTAKPSTSTAKTTTSTQTTFKPTTEKVVPTIAIKTAKAPVDHGHHHDHATPEPTFVPSIKPRGDVEPKTAQPMIVDKPVMTRLPPIVIPVDGTKQITFKPSFTPEHKDSDHSHGKSHEASKPPADLSTVDDSEQLDDDTITVIVVGSVIGILVFIAIIVILTTFLKSRRNASKQTEEKDDIEMNGGTKGIDNPLLQLEEEESMAANGTAGHANRKANGVVEGKAEESPKEIAKDSGAENISAEEKTTTENKSEDI